MHPVALIAALLSALVVTPAFAQDDEAARARVLFEEGLTAFDAGETERAEQLFRDSLAIRRSGSAVFNLATLLDREGELVEALALYREVTQSSGVPPEAMRIAEERIVDLAPRLAQELERSQNTEVEAPDPIIIEREVTVEAPSGPNFAGPAVLFGFTGAIAIAAAVTGGMALSIDSELAAECGPQRDSCPVDVVPRVNDGRTFTIVTDVLFGVAGAAAVAAVIWLIAELVD